VAAGAIKQEGGQRLGRLLIYLLIRFALRGQSRLLQHVLLSLSIGLERGTRRFDRRVEILDRVATFLTDSITELETLDFANRPDVQSAVVRAAAGCTRR